MMLARTPPTITALTPAIGAAVHGIDLSNPSDADADFVAEALVRHHVLFFRDQPLEPAAQLAFARRFGALHAHPIYPHVPGHPELVLLDTSADNPPDNDNWHTDVTFIQTPPMGSLLAAKRIPPMGGDTLWASTGAAYRSLSAPLQRLLDGLTATHDVVKSFPADRWGQGEARAAYDAARAKHPPVTHPVVRTHPVTGERGLFVNWGFTTRINELSPPESDALLALLFAHVPRPEHVVRWRWREGDVAFFDNRLTQHYACADYLPERRVMHRATILGDRPV